MITLAYPGADRDLSTSPPATRQLVAWLGQQTDICLGSSRRDDKFPDHRQGAVDLMTSDRAQQDHIKQLVINEHMAGHCRIISIITHGIRWTPSKGDHPYLGSSPHLDHVHVWIDPSAGFQGSGGTPPTMADYPDPGIRGGHQAYYGNRTGPVWSVGGARPSDRHAIDLIQHALRARGYQIACDGIFGSATERAVREFQRVSGLTEDGLVGRTTWATLRV